MIIVMAWLIYDVNHDVYHFLMSPFFNRLLKISEMLGTAKAYEKEANGYSKDFSDFFEGWPKFL